MGNNNSDFAMKTIEKIGVISEENGKTLELRKVEVKGVIKWDIRKWRMDGDQEKCDKGVRLTDDELLRLNEIINSMNEDE